MMDEEQLDGPWAGALSKCDERTAEHRIWRTDKTAFDVKRLRNLSWSRKEMKTGK